MAGLAALQQEFASAQDRMERLHMEAMDLAGEMERTAGVAASLHTTLRGGWQRGKGPRRPGSAAGGPGLSAGGVGEEGVEWPDGGPELIPAVGVVRTDSALGSLYSVR